LTATGKIFDADPQNLVISVLIRHPINERRIKWLQYGNGRLHLTLISQRGMGRAIAAEDMRVIAASAAKRERFICLSYLWFKC